MYAPHEIPFKFTHTYQERFWPKDLLNVGIRWGPGDLDDVVGLLSSSPLTRQAYLPIFFPEDTGAVHGGRIPCTLGYYFLVRDRLLHLWYEIRSCDAVRHFRDDLYLAARLQLWVLERLQEIAPEYWRSVQPGTFHFHAYSFHVHHGDLHLLQ
jgi:thymidylate synthase